MDSEINESFILTDCRDEGQSLNPQIGIDDLDPVSSMGPALGAERAEREHCLIEIHHSGL